MSKEVGDLGMDIVASNDRTTFNARSRTVLACRLAYHVEQLPPALKF